MLQTSIDIFRSNKPLSASTKEPISNYGDLLREYGLSYQETGYYLQVGDITWTQGWILHISVIRIQMESLLRRVIPILMAKNVPFQVVKDTAICGFILSGRAGLIPLGKVVSIYPIQNTQAFLLAEHLITETSSFRGPHILTDRHLGSVVYTRYGACKPLARPNEKGCLDEYIYDAKGLLIKDQHTIPFVPPTSIEWPFSSITSDKAPKKDSILANKYKTMKLLKWDMKGDVNKALWLKKWYKAKWCVIKEGKQNMDADAEGRDIGDNLYWQFELHKDLAGSLPLPRVYDFFKENGDTYLVMEYIKGASLQNIILSIFQGRTWDRLPLESRYRLLNYALQILDLIEIMHKKGYIHRDISPVNFLVDKKDQLWMIDLELAYSVRWHKPWPPFLGGTIGYMSPENCEKGIPNKQQDIFGIGCLLITLLTGMTPGKFTTDNPEVLKRQLAFFIPSEYIVHTIELSLNTNPDERPPIGTIKQLLEKLKQEQSSKVPETSITIEPPDKEDLKKAIHNALLGLSVPPLTNEGQLWVSKVTQEEAFSYYQVESTTVHEGFYAGVSGVLYVLALAYKMGFSIAPCMPSYEKGLSFITDRYARKALNPPAGLFAGTAGAAMAMAEGIKGGLLTNTSPVLSTLQSYLENKNKHISDFSLATGIAGQGMALLRSISILDTAVTETILQGQINSLLQQQQTDGSWLNQNSEKNAFAKATGFGTGIAGIICFLLGCNKYRSDDRLEIAASKALQWLTHQSHKINGQQIWYIDNKRKLIDPGMQNGMLGIALTFIKAFEVFQETVYQKMAEDILIHIPQPLITWDLTLASGLSGIGELYLEAVRVFQDDKWRKRADWIMQSILHQRKSQKDEACYWMADTTVVTTAGLMTGNSGIIHFLLRYHNPRALTHPLLTF